METLYLAALTLALEEGPAGPDAGTKTLVFGILAITAIAGLLDVWQLRSRKGWPVPLIIYATLLPIVTFVVVLSGLKDAGIGFEWLALPLAPLTLILFTRLRR